MWKTLCGLLLMVGRAVGEEAPMAEPGARVECHGKLRHGVVAVGGETTGTTLTFDGTTWELKLPDEATRKFAADHHKRPVTASGILRQVRGPERGPRWIIDVEKLSPRSDAAAKDGAIVTLTGTLQQQARTGTEPPTTTISAAGVTWRLDLTHDKSLLEQAKLNRDQLLLVTGQLTHGPDRDGPALRVQQLKPAKAAAKTAAK